MAVKMVSDDYKCEYIADTDADLENLAACTCTGSAAVSLESGRVKAVNTQGKWVEFGG